jgi:WxcM-like, C-terminal
MPSNTLSPPNGHESELDIIQPSPVAVARPRKASSIESCNLIELPKIADPRGNLTFIEGLHHVPFDIKRVFYLYDVPGGADRAGHALRSCHQFLIAMSGSFDVIVYDGKEKRRFHLNRSYYGLHLPPMIWREMDNFSSGSVCLALASECYDEKDYHRSYGDFLRVMGEDFK